MLSESLTALGAAQDFLITESARFSRAELSSWVNLQRARFPQLEGASIALKVSSDEDLALALLCCDGWGGSLLMLPPDIRGTDQQDHFYTIAEVSHELSIAGCEESKMGKVEFLHLNDGVTSEENRETAWLIATSGTTSTPKLVKHTLSSLSDSVKSDVGKGAQLVWGLLYDLYRFAGLQVFLQALMGGASLVLTDANQSLSDRLSVLANTGCNALSATPTLWKKILMTSDSLNMRLITLGGEIANQGILSALTDKFSDASIRHIYASTELGVGFAVNDGREGFPLEWLEEGPKGIELQVSENAQLRVKKKETKQKYLGEKKALRESDGFVDTGDLVKIVGDRVIFLGRENGAINVGGNKVQPEEVEALIEQVSGVSIVKVSGVENSFMGNLVEALLVLEDDADANVVKANVRELCIKTLEPYKRPAFIKVVDDLTLSSSGKVIRV